MENTSTAVPTYTANFDNENAARHAGSHYGNRGFRWAVVKIGQTYELRVFGGLSR